MSLTTSEMSAADIAAVTRNNNGNCGGYGMGGDWLIAIIILFLFPMMFGGGMFGGGMFGGMGGWGNAGMMAMANGALTRADLCNEFNFNGLENAVRGIQQGLCDGFYAMNTSMLNGFHGVDNAICNLGFTTQQGFNATQVAMMQGQNALQTQLADCCCTTQRAIDGINYNMATNTCALQNTMNNNTRDIIDNQNANSRAILDYLCQDKISTLQNENQALRLAASQSNQNAVLMAAMDANKAEILRRTGAECPTAAYIVQPPTPVTFPTNCCGQASFSGNNCGCNSGCGNCGF
ncbi:hypothetical protein [Bacteroides congonensis]|uniref:hypothetical protein n=1 Tax=Bacteroides congonensis TaxID=1871006 RepID=UPI00265EF018|nr:hypothetical protein [Bacteroides congonensis]